MSTQSVGIKPVFRRTWPLTQKFPNHIRYDRHKEQVILEKSIYSTWPLVDEQLRPFFRVYLNRHRFLPQFQAR